MGSASAISGRNARQPTTCETVVNTFSKSMGTRNPEFTGCNRVADGPERPPWFWERAYELCVRTDVRHPGWRVLSKRSSRQY